MGFAKDELIRHQENKWKEIEEKLLCRSCLETDSGLTEFFSLNSKLDRCGYCLRKKKVLSINSLLEFIAECIHRVYTDPANELPYDGAEGGYLGASVYSSEELLDQSISFNDEKVREDIVSAFDSCAAWSERDCFGDRESDDLSVSWSQFSNKIKYETRYFFPRPKSERVRRIQKSGPQYPGDILSYILKLSRELKFFRTLKKGTTLYRARKFEKPEDVILNLKNMGVPTNEISAKSATRLSPAGIPIFYGGFSTEILGQEIRAEPGDLVHVGKFQVNKNILVLDLTKIPRQNIFAIKHRDQQEVITFLNQFRDEIMVPVKLNGSEHLEYVPSQVFSEFLRHRTPKKEQVMGILYPSTSKIGGINAGLYITNKQISEDKNDEAVLRFLGIESKADVGLSSEI